jgi:long-chain fatty acid transport protein
MKTKNQLLQLLALAALPAAALATNGDNLIAIGPIARGMGGLSVAYPQDPISAVFANPAAMCFGPYCPVSEMNLSITAFMPDVEASVTDSTGAKVAASSDDKVYLIPAIGFSHPLKFDEQDRWRIGMSAYGVSGLGVDYKDSAINSIFTGTGTGPTNPPIPFVPGNPWTGAGLKTELMIAKVAPAIAYKVLPNLSVGGSIHLNYSELEIFDRKSDGTTLGFQIGGLYTPVPNVYIGASYTSPQTIKYDSIIPAGQPPAPPAYNALKLEAPQQIAAGISTELLDKRLVLGIEARWINWGDADGYSDFGWKDQYVIALGGQYAVMPEKFIVRAGYNFGNNPVDENNGFDGSFSPTGMPNDVVTVQGTPFPRYYYETFRIIGFPAIVEHHVTLGASWFFKENISVNFAYMHAFENTIRESGTSPLGTPTTIESTLLENSIEIGFSWRF